MENLLNNQKVSRCYEHDCEFCDQYEEICDNSEPENQIFRPDNLLRAINIVTHPSEIRQDTSSVLLNVQSANGIIFGAIKLIGLFVSTTQAFLPVKLELQFPPKKT